MALSRYSPDAILESVNLDGTLADIQDDPDSPDGNWLTATDRRFDGVLRVSFPDLGAPLEAGDDYQTFRFQARPSAGNGTAVIHVKLYEAGVDTGVGETHIITEPTVITFNWDAGVLANPTGDDVEFYIRSEGDDRQVVWAVRNVDPDSEMMELDTADFSIVRSVSGGALAAEVANGVGGNTNKIWTSGYYRYDSDDGRLRELNPTDFTQIRALAMNDTSTPFGAVVDDRPEHDLLAYYDYDNWEHMSNRFESSLNQRSTVGGSRGWRGLGGNAEAIWYCDEIDDTVGETESTNWTVIRSAPSPFTAAQGIGGDKNTIYHTDTDNENIYELDPEDFSVMRFVAMAGYQLRGIDGA